MYIYINQFITLRLLLLDDWDPADIPWLVLPLCYFCVETLHEFHIQRSGNRSQCSFCPKAAHGGLYIPLYLHYILIWWVIYPIISHYNGGLYIPENKTNIYIYILNAIQITIIYVFCFLLKLRQFLGIPWTHRISLEQKNLGFTMTKPCKWYWVGKNNNPQNGTCLWFMKHINDSYTTLYYQFVEEHYYIMTLMTVPQ